MRIHSTRGASTLFFLGLGVVIGVIIVIFSASFMKWKNQARAARTVPPLPHPLLSHHRQARLHVTNCSS